VDATARAVLEGLGLTLPATTGGPTLLRPEEHRRSQTSDRSHGFPTDLVQRATSRVRTLALLYAAIFFLAGFFPNLFNAHDRAMLFSSPVHWLPGTLSIVIAIVVAEVIRSPRFSPAAAAAVALIFEVASSYGIAAAEFLNPLGLRLVENGWIGLSWVAVWMLLFTIVVPTKPRQSLVAALGASSGVPVMAATSFAVFPPPLVPNAFQFFFIFIFPYLLVVVMAYVGSCVLFALGDEVRKARELGSYRLIERIGAGGMGEVWRASHRLLARPAAVKLIRPSASAAIGVSAAAKRRFEREAQALARLRSPHTVHLFDFGIADDGTFYYVMELLDGLDVDRLVREYGPLPVERVVHVIRQMCHSLSEAESVGLVHRDIKPANIVVCRYGEDYDFVKLLDFGIVKALHEPADTEGAPTLTVEHVVAGTPAFIAPEQALNAATVDHRTDLYAVGCVAYWLVTGQLVFTSDTPIGLVLHHAHTAPERPSTRTELPIPQALDDLIMACLAKNPDDRPQTARELVHRLDAVPLTTAWSEERARAWWQQHRPQAVDDSGTRVATERPAS
jgi:eukaryotic-like serine/threonine-protein kinase